MGGHLLRLAPPDLAGNSDGGARHRVPDTLVEAVFHAVADVGSIPTVSTLDSQALQSPIRRLGRLSRCGIAASATAACARRQHSACALCAAFTVVAWISMKLPAVG